MGYNHYNIKQLMRSARGTVLRIEIFVGFIKIKKSLQSDVTGRRNPARAD